MDICCHLAAQDLIIMSGEFPTICMVVGGRDPKARGSVSQQSLQLTGAHDSDWARWTTAPSCLVWGLVRQSNRKNIHSGANGGLQCPGPGVLAIMAACLHPVGPGVGVSFPDRICSELWPLSMPQLSWSSLYAVPGYPAFLVLGATCGLPINSFLPINARGGFLLLSTKTFSGSVTGKSLRWRWRPLVLLAWGHASASGQALPRGLCQQGLSRTLKQCGRGWEHLS